jgi:hypothetical protein
MSSYEYHQILQFLYFEGYADSYEEAEELVESLSDDEFEELNEIRAQKPWSETKIKRFNKEIERQKKQRKKTPHSSLRPADQEALGRMLAGDPPPESRDRKPSPTRSSRENEPKAQPEEKKPKGRRTDMSKVIVAHYLFDEGYADSIDGAEVMAESISDNWVQSILSESDIEPPKERLVTDRNMFNISQEERDAARERTLAKAKAAREKKKNR